MAVHKVKRSNSPAQPQPQQAKDPKPKGRPDHQRKADLLETLRHLNRGFGVVLSAFNRLEAKDRQQRFFPAAYLADYRKRTEALRARANHDLLRSFAGHEEQDAVRFDGPVRRGLNGRS
jgi:hypothetical protein